MSSRRRYFVYILASASNRVLYVGVTSDLERRVHEHKAKLVPGFTARYNVHKLVYFEETEDVRVALEREKQIKSWRRSRKDALVGQLNPDWSELALV